MRSQASKNHLLTLLMVVLVFNTMDRLALGIVLQDLKIDLHLNDTELGLLTGIAFALFYAVMGVPIARWADRGNRVTIISVTTALWSGAVALCGAATSFAQLLLIRVGAAVGEAGCMPPALSLIADRFTREERPRAVARYMLGVPVSLTLGYFAAGWLNQLYGWRWTFVIVGLPGLALAALTYLTLDDARRTEAAMEAAHTSSIVPSLREVCKTLWANRAFRHLLLGNAVWAFFGYGILQWTPAFFIRSHGLQTGELGTWFAVVYGIGGGLGVYLGGEWASRYAPDDERRQLNVCALAFVIFSALTAGAFITTDYHWAFAALAAGALGGNLAQGPIYATLQTLVPSRMRAMSTALVFFFTNLIGVGLGPLTVGALSDALQPGFGQESLRYALVILCPGYFWAAWHLQRAGKTVARDLRAAEDAGAVRAVQTVLATR